LQQRIKLQQLLGDNVKFAFIRFTSAAFRACLGFGRGGSGWADGTAASEDQGDLMSTTRQVRGSSAASGTGVVTGTSANGSAVITTSPRVYLATFDNAPAASAQIIAQIAADTDEVTWANITQPTIPRVVQVVFSALWDGGDIEVTGLLESSGDDGTDTIAANPGATVQGAKAFRYIRRVRNLGAHSAGTADVQTGIALGIQCHGLTPTLLEAYELSALGRDVGAAISPLGSVTWTSAPDGARDFSVSYSLAVASTDSGHGHGAGTYAGPSHDHAAGTLAGPSHDHGAGTYAGPSHDHTGPSHDHAAGTYAGPSHDHGVGTIADSGHDHGPGTHTHTTTPDAHVIA
jgi:hypothetical protein